MIEILDGMYGREDISFLTVRHEQSAALMADAYARLTERWAFAWRRTVLEPRTSSPAWRIR